jgi:hypothetical protein
VNIPAKTKVEIISGNPAKRDAQSITLRFERNETVWLRLSTSE